MKVHIGQFLRLTLEFISQEGTVIPTPNSMQSGIVHWDTTNHALLAIVKSNDQGPDVEPYASPVGPVGSCQIKAYANFAPPGRPGPLAEFASLDVEIVEPEPTWKAQIKAVEVAQVPVP